MVRIAAATLGDEVQFKVLSTEVDRAGDSYTIDTLKELKKKNKDADFYLVVGADQLEKFDQWRNHMQILKMASLVVTSRPDFNLPEEKALLPAWLRKEVKSFRSGKGLLKTGRHLHFLKLNDLNISATDIRRKIRRGESATHLTPTEVVEYIKQNKIYDPSDVLVSDYSEFTRFCAQILSDKGGLEVCAYDLRNLVQPAEYTLVASGTSTRHAAALCEQVIQKAKERYGIYPQSIEGLQEGRWVVVDYGALMIHVFYDYVRGEYRIENLWSEAPKLTI